MKYKKMKKYASPAIPLFMSLLLASCAPNNQAAGNETLNTADTAPQTEGLKTEEHEESASLDSQAFPAEETASSAKETASRTEETASADNETISADETAAPDAVSLGNPMKPVDSEKDFTALGLHLSLPENEAWCSGRSYFIIDGKVAQIAFYDEMTKSDAIARAGSEQNGDPSGIYYNFDEEKEETWTAFMDGGTQIDITVSVTVDNSDVHGVLAAWTYKGVRYSLWEDSARDHISEVGKLAVEMAKAAK